MEVVFWSSQRSIRLPIEKAGFLYPTLRQGFGLRQKRQPCQQPHETHLANICPASYAHDNDSYLHTPRLARNNFDFSLSLVIVLGQYWRLVYEICVFLVDTWLLPMESRVHSILAVNILFFSITWITVSLRAYVRTVLLKSFGLDDSLMVATLVLFTGYLICQLGGLVHGTGRHVADLEPDQIMIALRVRYARTHSIDIYMQISYSCAHSSFGGAVNSSTFLAAVFSRLQLAAFSFELLSLEFTSGLSALSSSPQPYLARFTFSWLSFSVACLLNGGPL